MRPPSLLVAGLLLPAVGCASTASKQQPVVASPLALAAEQPVRQVAHETPAALDLAELLDLAAHQNPDLTAARARVDEARGKMVQAGLYPNPTVGYQGSQINDGPGTSGQQGGYVGQEFVTGGKLKVARSAAGHGLSASERQALTRWFETASRVRTAHAEAQTARLVAAESDRIVAEFESGLARAESLARAGTAFAYEVSRWRVEVSQARYRNSMAKQRIEAADRLLAAAVGLPRLPAPLVVSPLSSECREVDFESLAAAADRSSAVLDAEARVEQARCEVRLAELQNIPNVMVQAGAAQDAIINSALANVQAGVTLPVWNRNQGNILAARARLATAAAEVEKVHVQQRERLAAAVQRVANARRQLDLLDREILPDAERAVEQVRQIYEVRGERFFETLDARRTFAHARIDRLNAVGELQSALAEIDAVAQQAGKP